MKRGRTRRLARRPRARQRAWWARVWARPWLPVNPRAWQLGLLALVLILALGMFAGSAVIGLMEGMRESAARQAQEADFHYRQGLVYLRAGQRDLALAEFREALRLNPEHLGAQRQVLTLLLPTPTPIPTPTPVPTPTVDPERPLRLILKAAEEDLAQGRWQTAYVRLEQLHALAPDFERDRVTALLYQAAMGEGRSLLEEDRMEEALRAFDRALRWRPNDREAQRLRDLTEAYILGISYFYADWDNAITIFESLYRQAPTYKDVAQRYQEALAQGAAYHLKRGDPCRAAAYLERLAILAADRVSPSDLAEARNACAAAFEDQNR